MQPTLNPLQRQTLKARPLSSSLRLRGQITQDTNEYVKSPLSTLQPAFHHPSPTKHKCGANLNLRQRFVIRSRLHSYFTSIAWTWWGEYKGLERGKTWWELSLRSIGTNLQFGQGPIPVKMPLTRWKKEQTKKWSCHRSDQPHRGNLAALAIEVGYKTICTPA